MSEAAFERIESERLVLRRFRDSDLAPFVAYRNDPEVARYQSWDHFEVREARDFIREMGTAQPVRASGSSSQSNRRRQQILSETAPCGSTGKNPIGPR